MFTILHIIPTLEGGGAERQLVMMAKEQAKRGWNVHIGLRRVGVNGSLLEKSGVIVHQLGDFKSLHPMMFLSIYKVIKQVKPNLVQTWLSQMDVVGGVVALWCSVVWIMTERNSSKFYLGMPLIGSLRKLLAKKAQAIIANSKQGVNYWRENLPFAGQIYTINNAVDVASIRAFPLGVVDGLNSNNNLLLSVGRLVPEKCHDLLIRAVSLLPGKEGIQAYIIGKGPLLNELETVIHEYGVDKNISVLPYNPRWWGILKNANALVSMSRFEGAPNVLLEAMAAGCPLIVSDIREHREILDDNSALFVPPDDIQALKMAIMSVLSNKLVAKERATKAALYVENLTIESVVDAYSKVYASALNWSEI